MQVTYGLDDAPDGVQRVVTVGAFDGLHIGHQYLIRRTAAEAATRGMESAVLTFEPIPHEFFSSPGHRRVRLTTRDERIELMSDIGVDHLVFAEFTEALSQLSADEFARDVLHEKLNVSVLVASRNHHLGASAEADIDDIRQLGRQYGFDLLVTPLVSLDGVRISSTQIRQHLNEGNVSQAAALLGRCYGLGGEVVTGHGRGRTLGYPTANIAPPANKVIPAQGVYAAFVDGAGVACAANGRPRPCPAAVHIGPQPTFDDPEPTIEVFIHTDKPLDLAGSHLDIRLVRRLRDIKDFDTPEDLSEQIGRDVKAIRRFLGG
ncbi:MAG: riboflavin biosynthesis protein RibF [Armatimonadota bacterium]